MIVAFDHRVENDVHVLTPKKNLVGGQETVALASVVQGLPINPTPKVVLDLHKISWVSSLGIEELRRVHHSCSERDGWMRLACIGSRIENIILTMRLDWVFDTFDTVDAALVAPARKVAPPVTSHTESAR